MRRLILCTAIVLAASTLALAQQRPDRRLRSKEPAERMAALRALHRTRLDARTAAAVLELGREEPHPHVRAVALTVLGTWLRDGPPESKRAAAVDVLESALSSESSWIRCGASEGLAAAGPWAAGASSGLLALVDDPDRSDAHPAALLALGNAGDLDDVGIELVAGMLTSDDPVIVGCAARAVGRQGPRALAAVARLANVFPADDEPGPLPEEPPPGGDGIFSWLDLRGQVFGEASRNIIFEGGGVMYWFAERDGRRFVRIVASSYNGPPPPPPPEGAPPDPDHERLTREHESLGWAVGFHEIEVTSDADGVVVEIAGALDGSPWTFPDDGARLERPVDQGVRSHRRSYRQSAISVLRGEMLELVGTALVRICGDASVPGTDAALAALLEHPSRDVRVHALRMLNGRPAMASSAAALLRMVVAERRFESDLAAAAFRSIPEGAGDVLREALLSDDPRLRWKAITLAAGMGAQSAPVAEVLGDWLTNGGPMDEAEILRAIARLGSHGAPAIAALVAFAGTKRPHHEEALRVLGGMGPGARDALSIVLHFARTRPGFGHGRLAATRALASIAPDHPELPGFIVALCTDPNDNVVEHTLMWVNGMSPPPEGTVEAVLELVLRDEWGTRRAAAAALGRLGRGRKDVSVVLAGMLDDEHPWVQVVAAEALDQVDPGHPRVVPVLRRLLRNEDWNQRWHATMALEHIGPRARAALPDLRRHADDPDEHGHVRRGARKAIEAIEAGD